MSVTSWSCRCSAAWRRLASSSSAIASTSAATTCRPFSTTISGLKELGQPATGDKAARRGSSLHSNLGGRKQRDVKDDRTAQARHSRTSEQYESTHQTERSLLQRPRHLFTSSTQAKLSAASNEPLNVDSARRNEPEWLKHRQAMKQKFLEGWRPPKRLSREAMSLIRTLNKSQPQVYTTAVLSKQFKVSAEAVRRILKSKFELSEEEQAKREEKRKAERTKALQQAGYQATWGGNFAGERQEMTSLRSSASSETDKFAQSRTSPSRSSSSPPRSREGRSHSTSRQTANGPVRH
ncbi:hypothetical protein ACM66B_003903 [Microbotryomycetes sp. NB124-2]